MAMLRLALSALLLGSTVAPATVSAQANDGLVLDNTDPRVQVLGTWTATSTTPGFQGADYTYRVPGDGKSTVRWPFPPAAPAGRYELQARWTSGPNRATQATYEVSSRGGFASVRVDQQKDGATWQTLGTFEFAPNATDGVTLSDKADGVVVADAVRWLPAASAPLTPAQPAAATAPVAAPVAGGTTQPAQPTQPAPAPAAAPAPQPAPVVAPPAAPAPQPATVVAPPAVPAPPTQAAPPVAGAANRTFSQTGFRVDRDAFWDFFLKRGGDRTFGYPVSREFLFMGCSTQLYQRLAMQQCGGDGVGTLNMLDGGLLPYTQINGSTFPGPDPFLISAAPSPANAEYDTRAIEFVQRYASETVDGEPTAFFTTFQTTVRLEDAFPNGGGNADLLPLLNLQVWGLPTSRPARDPNNHDFIYQRFQRGIMHYDKGCRCTQGLLLADAFKSLLTGEHLPNDLAAQAAESELLRAAAPSGRVPQATQFGDAFVSPLVPTPTVAVAAGPVIPPASAPALAPPPVASPDYGINMFVWGHPGTTDRDLRMANQAGFRWQKTLFEWRKIEGAGKGQFDWSEADRVVRASAQSGIKVIARLDFQPGWARRDGAHNGPPDNPQDFADFVRTFVTRYGSASTIGRVHAIQVWNEPNIDREWGLQPINQQAAADYVRLVGAAYTAAKAVDPSVYVLTAGLSPTGVNDGRAADDLQYLEWMYAAGLKGKFDALGAHANTQAPEVDIALGSLPTMSHASFYFRRIEQLRDVMVRNGDGDKKVWLLEFGWTADKVNPNYSWFAVSEDKKAANLVKAFEYARQKWAPWIGVMTVWTMADPSWTPEREEYWWAITNPDGSPRPAFTALLPAMRAAGV